MSPRRRARSNTDYAAPHGLIMEESVRTTGRATKRRSRDDGHDVPSELTKRRVQQVIRLSRKGSPPPTAMIEALVHSTMLEGAKLVAQIPLEARQIPPDQYTLDSDDRAWVSALNWDSAACNNVSNMSSPERSSGSDATAHGSDGEMRYIERRAPQLLTEAQFATIIEQLEMISAIYSRTEGVHEEQACTICEACDGLPPWPICRRVYLYWLEKRQRQNHAPLLKEVWAKHQKAENSADVLERRPLAVVPGGSMDGAAASAANARRGDAGKGGAQVLAATLRRHSSAVQLPEGIAGERVAQILDSIGLQTGQLQGNIGAAVQAAICHMRKENGCTAMISGKKRGEKVGSCNFEVPGMSRLELGSLDATNDVQESLLGASLLVRKDDLAAEKPSPAPAPAAPVSTRSLKRPPPAPSAQLRVRETEKGDSMTYIVPDDPFDSNWSKLLARVAQGKQASAPANAAAPKRCVSVPPQFSSSLGGREAAASAPQCVVPVMGGSAGSESAGIKLVLPPGVTRPFAGAPGWPQHAAAQRAMLAMPEQIASGEGAGGAAGHKPVQQYILMSPVGMNQQGVFQVPYPFVLQQGKPVAGKDGIVQLPGPTWAVGPAKALPALPCLSHADMPRRPQSTPPHGSSTSSFGLHCAPHPLLVASGQVGNVCQGHFSAAQAPSGVQAAPQHLPPMPPPTSAH